MDEQELLMPYKMSPKQAGKWAEAKAKGHSKMNKTQALMDAVNSMPDRIGKWSVNYYGAKKYAIEETTGPGIAKLVKVYEIMDEAYAVAFDHNGKLLPGKASCGVCGNEGHTSTKCLWN
jgi:hypothetical protein